MTKHQSEKWLRDFAERWNFDFPELIRAASAAATPTTYNYAVARGIDLHSPRELGQDHDLFWSHLEVYTGKRFNVEHQRLFTWSCSC